MKLTATVVSMEGGDFWVSVYGNGRHLTHIACSTELEADDLAAHLNRDPEDVNELIRTAQWARDQLDELSDFTEVIPGYEDMDNMEREAAEDEHRSKHNEFIRAMEDCTDAP